MLAQGSALVLDARATARAVAAFTVYTLEPVRAVCDTAEQTGPPVILQAGSSSYRETSRSMLASAALAAARDEQSPADLRQLQRLAVTAMTDLAVEKLTVLAGHDPATGPARKDA
jgi:fructose/tagatose bisphosphate aldolase